MLSKGTLGKDTCTIIEKKLIISPKTIWKTKGGKIVGFSMKLWKNL